MTAITSPSHGESHTSTPTPTTTVSAFTTRKIPENITNQRIVVRSEVARDSSWPDAQRSWKATGSRCRCAYRSARMVASTWLAAPATSSLRSRISPASTAPNASTPSTSQGRVPSSPRATGPSTIARVTSGIASPARVAVSAATPLPISAARCGRT